MAKEEVLQDIDRLCEDLDRCIWNICKAAQNKDDDTLNNANIDASRMVICAHHELSFLRYYIEDNVKEK